MVADSMPGKRGESAKTRASLALVAAGDAGLRAFVFHPWKIRGADAAAICVGMQGKVCGESAIQISMLVS